METVPRLLISGGLASINTYRNSRLSFIALFALAGKQSNEFCEGGSRSDICCCSVMSELCFLVKSVDLDGSLRVLISFLYLLSEVDTPITLLARPAARGAVAFQIRSEVKIRVRRTDRALCSYGI